ncbi:hypothetical protein GOBAR_AA20453 [Gossypium barbadense]|uniref:Uncharacterized protein n=1 Tax=Gossypium barbadense TaxID=3634 RepID=A0A2P5XA60_GOSBA|nr:hypothetical protein GOBAR_AA20453 [Gossypium barbadense]
MSSSRGKKTAVLASKKRKRASSSAGPNAKIRHPLLQFPRGPQEELFQILRARPLIAGHCTDWIAVEQTVMTNYDDPGTVQFRLGRLIRQLSIPEFGAALGLYTEEFKEENELHALSRHIHFSPSKCWHTLALGTASYNPSRFKASVLPPSLRTYPSQYRLTQSTEEEAYEDIPDDVPPQHEGPPLSHHHLLVQFMRWLHTLTSLSASLDLSNSVFNDLTTLMLLYSRFVSTSISHRRPTSRTIQR